MTDPVGAGRVTIEDVALRAGVSVATVSRALRNLPNVAPSTREKVRRVAGELDYRVDPHASRLAAGRTRTVGMAVPMIDSWYFSTVVAGAEAVLADDGYDVLLVNIDSEAKRRRLLGPSAGFANRVDGLILVDIALPADEEEALARHGTRVVTVGHRSERFGWVGIDDVVAASMATRHLVGFGHRHVGLIWAPDRSSLGFRVPLDRRRGYEEVLANAGVPLRDELRAAGDASVEGGAEAMAALLSARPGPTAVFVMSDEMAFGALRCARDLGVRVPEDVSVIGFDDHPMADVVRLTTVRQQVDDHGAAAARLLLSGLEGEATEPARHLVHSTRLVVRDTTAARRRT